MTDHDAREALRECPFCGGKAMRKEDPGVIGEMFGLVVDHAPGCFLTLRGIEADEVFDAAWNTRSLPAPTPAAGSSPGLDVDGICNDHGKFMCKRCLAPQPPAPGGEGLAELIAMLSAAVPNELGGGTFDHSPEEIGTHVMEHYRSILAALANHSPDAGGVGEAWVCDGISDEVIEAGISAWDAAKHDMENYVSGVTTDWDEGMIVAAIYKAMSAALCPADAEGGE